MMSTRESNPRALREVNARFNYDVRNKGALAAVDAMHARNAEKRKQEAAAARQAVAKDFNAKAEAALRGMKRADFSKLTD